ncbi:MAG TPA: glycosyltransferase family 9 protein [Mycobacteriales bacterium]|nr:glycosyltransferase family 9 protein [Mycobacteriales bacterium]
MTRRVLIVRLDNDGDVLLAGPAVRAVAAQAEVTLLCGPRGRQAAQLLPGVREVLRFRAPWIDPEPQPVERGAMLAVVDELAARGFDEAVVLTSFHQSALPTALLLRMAGVPVVAAISEDYPGSLLDVRHHVPDGVHEVERGLSLVSTLGYRLPDGDDGRLAVRRRAASAPLPFAAPYVVVHPTASVPARAWPVERNAELVALLAAEGWNVAVTGTAADAGTTAVVAGPPREQVRDLTGATDFAGLADVIAGASVVVVGNTGPAHLAAAVGTPVVSLFAPTVPAAAWAPYGVPVALLGVQDIACGGCRARVCPVPGHPCLSAVTAQEAAAAVRRLAGRPAALAVPG